jgi:hypothetical protein
MQPSIDLSVLGCMDGGGCECEICVSICEGGGAGEGC